MLLKARETIFFYKIDQILRQAIEVEYNNLQPDITSLKVEINTKRHGKCITAIKSLKQGINNFTCFAPVVYPNFVNGKLRPVFADIILRSNDAILYEGTLEIGKHRPWTIFICQDICTDFTWGLPFDQTMEESRAMIREQLKYMDKTDGLPYESKNRWNINQTMEVEWFTESEEENLIRKLFERESEGRIEISATYNSNLTAMLSVEQGIRSLYYARELSEKYGIKLNTVEHIEMPTITWGMISIYAKAGIKYFTKGWLDFNSHYLKKSENIPLFYWQGPDGGSVLAFMDRGANLRSHYGHASFFSGSMMQKPMTYEEIKNELHNWWIPHYENNQHYPYDCFMMLGAYIDLHVTSKFEIETLINNIIRYNNEPWEYPKLINATWSQYFERIEKLAGQNGICIPVLKGDMGTSWEDWPAHYANVASKMKRGIEDFITAEKIVAIECALSNKLDKIKVDILKLSAKLMNQLAEHPWNGSNEDEKYRSFNKRCSWVKQLNSNNNEILQTFGFKVPEADPLQTKSINIWNFMSWDRTGEIHLDMRCMEMCNKEFSDAGYQSIEEFGVRKISLIAKDVPGLGYKKLEHATVEGVKKGEVSVGNFFLENDFYRIQINKYDGSIESIWDKKNGQELVDCNEELGLNQFLYESDKNIFRLSNVKVMPINCGYLRSSLLIEGETLRCKVQTILTLYSCIDKIGIKNKIIKEPSSEPLNIYFAFPFNIPEREYHYECMGSIIKPGLKEFGGDNLKGAGQEVYAARNFVDISNKNYGVTLSPHDSYLFQFGGLTYDVMPDFPQLGNATVYSLVMTNHAYVEILRDQARNSEFEFNYSLMSHKGGFDPVTSLKFGWGENNPLMACYTDAENEGISNHMVDKEKLFIACLNDNIIITAFKPCESFDGSYILRLWEIGGKNTAALVDVSNIGFSKAYGCDIIERENGLEYPFIKKGIIEIPIRPFSIETIKLKK